MASSKDIVSNLSDAQKLPPMLTKLHDMMRNDPSQGRDPNGAWDQAWAQNVTPWDAAEVQPALKELVDERWHRGYDATFFAARGLDSLGIDLSPLAVQAAQKHYEETESAPKNVTFQAADFFDFTPPTSGFDLAYDYTFFCAIPPELRQPWAVRYAQLIRKGGVLITLEFPIDGDREWGPPYSVSEDMYEQHLGDKFEKIYSETPGASLQERQGREVMAVWKRK